MYIIIYVCDWWWSNLCSEVIMRVVERRSLNCFTATFGRLEKWMMASSRPNLVGRLVTLDPTRSGGITVVKLSLVKIVAFFVRFLGSESRDRLLPRTTMFKLHEFRWSMRCRYCKCCVFFHCIDILDSYD